jgi:hypothetical protein
LPRQESARDWRVFERQAGNFTSPYFGEVKRMGVMFLMLAAGQNARLDHVEHTDDEEKAEK